MSNTINIGGIEVSKFYLGGSSDVKIYLGTTKLYPHLQEPCFAVVEDISQYSDTEFEDVYDKATEKWFKLNNLNQYEKYGIYGSGRSVTTYEGKLTIDDGYEYEWNGSLWVNLGEVSGSSRVPIGYTEVEYIQNTGTSYLNTNFVPNQDTRVVCDMQNVTASSYPRLWGAGVWNSANGLMIDYDPNQFQVSWLGNTTWTNYSAYPTSTSYNRHTYDLNKNYMYIDEALVGSNTYTTRTASDTIGVFTYIGSGRPSSSSYWGQEHFKGKMYSFQIYDNGTLVRDLVPCKRDNDNTVGAYDIVNDVFYTVPTGYTTDKLIAGAETGTTEYPKYYDEIQDPPDNLVFNSMAEAEAYECPWVGMTAIIDNADYLFCESYEWLTKYEYQEVSGEYLCDSGNKYKKMQEYDRLVDGTMSATTNYVIGDLIESGSPDCAPQFISLQDLASTYPTLSISHAYRFTNYSDVSGITYFRIHPSKATTQSSYVFADHNADNATGTTKFAIKSDANGSLYSKVGGYSTLKAAADASSCAWAYWVDADTIEVDVVTAVGTTIFIKQWQTYFVTDYIEYKFT